MTQGVVSAMTNIWFVFGAFLVRFLMVVVQKASFFGSVLSVFVIQRTRTNEPRELN
mgnify:FL=1